MFCVLKLVVGVVLVSTTIVSSNERKKRADWIDLGTSIVLPWENLNNGGLNNINNRYQNGRDAQQQSGWRINNGNQDGRNAKQQLGLNINNLYQNGGDVQQQSGLGIKNQYQNGRVAQQQLGLNINKQIQNGRDTQQQLGLNINDQYQNERGVQQQLGLNINKQYQNVRDAQQQLGLNINQQYQTERNAQQQLRLNINKQYQNERNAQQQLGLNINNLYQNGRETQQQSGWNTNKLSQNGRGAQQQLGLNINNLNKNGRDAQQQLGLRNSIQQNNNENQYSAGGAINLNQIEQKQNQNLNGNYGQNRYSGLGAYSVFSPNVNEYEESQSTGPRQSKQYLGQTINSLNSGLNYGSSVGTQGNLNYNEIVDLERQLKQQKLSALRLSNIASIRAGLKAQNEGLIDSGRLNQLNKLEGRTLPQIVSGQSNENTDDSLNQQQYRNQILHNIINNNQIRQSLAEQQSERLSQAQAAQLQLSENNLNGQKLVNIGQNVQIGNVENRGQLESTNQNLGINPISYSSQYQGGLNVQQPNVYTYGELTGRIWKVIRSNPSLMSDLGSLREDILNGGASENPQVRELASLLQEAQKYDRNNLAPIEGQIPEEQQQNVIVNNLIDTMNRNAIIASPVHVHAQLPYGK